MNSEKNKLEIKIHIDRINKIKILITIKKKLAEKVKTFSKLGMCSTNFHNLAILSIPEAKTWHGF